MSKKEYNFKFDDGRYVDETGRNVIVDRIAKCVYIVPKSNNKQYSIMRMRNAFVIAIGMAVMVFFSITIGIVTLIGCFAAAEIFYRCVYLKKLQKITDIELPSKPTLVERYATDNDGTMILMCLLSIALLIVLPMYVTQSVESIPDAIQFKNLNGSMIVYGSIIFIVLALYLIYATISVLISRRKK